MAQGPARKKTLKVRRPVPAPESGMPSDDELLGYLDGALDPDRERDVERRLFGCAYAVDRLWILREALAEAG